MSKLLRVTQLDAIQLDNEITNILKSSFDNAIKFLPPGFTVPFEPEIDLIIRILIFKYSLMKNNATFGQKLLLIKYENLTNSKKYLYILLSCVTYLKSRLERTKLVHKFRTPITWIEIVIRSFSFINLSVFLRTGTKPLLLDRLLDLNQVYATDNIPRRVGNSYLTRELLWNGFIELLVFIIPLINYHKLKRISRNMFSFTQKKNILKSEHRIYNTYTRCPHCLEVPIQPHHMGCPHIFCYVCLKSNQLADRGYECPLCAYTDTICERVAVF